MGGRTRRLRDERNRFVKRRELIRQLERAGCILVRHGARHDIYRNPATGQQQPVPRHDDVDDDLAKHIKKVPWIENLIIGEW